MFWNRKHSAIVVKSSVAVLVGLGSLNISLTTCLSVKRPLDGDLQVYFASWGKKGGFKEQFNLELRTASLSWVCLV